MEAGDTKPWIENMDTLSISTLAVAAVMGAIVALVFLWSDSYYYWRHPIAHVFDDAQLLGIKIPTAILFKGPPDADLSWSGMHRYARQLREEYGVARLSRARRKMLRRERERRREAGLPLAE